MHQIPPAVGMITYNMKKINRPLKAFPIDILLLSIDNRQRVTCMYFKTNVLQTAKNKKTEISGQFAGNGFFLNLSSQNAGNAVFESDQIPLPTSSGGGFLLNTAFTFQITNHKSQIHQPSNSPIFAAMKMIEVKAGDANAIKLFLSVPLYIYKSDPNWIRPLDKDIESVFDPAQNPAFKNGELIRWVLINDSGMPVGRVAAFINRELIANMEDPAGGIGFFECINDKTAAFILFDACADWLQSRDIHIMDGPVNFGERDRFWGLLVEGFGPPSYMENYNPEYYRELFERYGFQLYFDQKTYLIDKYKVYAPRLDKISKWVARKPNLRFEHITKKDLRKYIDDFVYVYNKSWDGFENFKPVTSDDIYAVFKSMLPIMIPEFIWFAYVDDEPAGFNVFIPEVNQVFKYVNGKLDLLGKLKFAWHQLIGSNHKVKGLVFGILPKYQNLGIDAVLSYYFYLELMKKKQYRDVGISWIGGFNPKMNSLIEALSGEVEKVHYTYRKMLDDTMTFKPYSIGK